MSKRRFDSDDLFDWPIKRSRSSNEDRLSRLSDELLLRILSHLPVATLLTCQRLSHRFQSIASDSQLWKSAYYNRFVRPRASRIPGIKDNATPTGHLLYSSRSSKWLDDEGLVRRGQGTNWKRQYKLRHNWSKGNCDVSEIQVAERPTIPPLLVRLHERTIITVDSTAGLRAWGMKEDQKLLASRDIPAIHGAATSLALDTTENNTKDIEIAVGFEDGAFETFTLDRDSATIDHRCTHPPSTNGMVTAVAFSWPYLVTMTEGQLLSVYTFGPIGNRDRLPDVVDSPRLLSSLKSHTVWPPLCLSIRPSSQRIVVSIAYALPTYLSGWSVGIQELWVTFEGDISESRLASAVTQGFQPLSPSPSGASSPSPSRNDRDFNYSLAKPTSLSYSHPYLLASHPDNTLTLYLVTSTATKLSIGSGTRLWGHTSSVSGAHVGGKGKAVSVSTPGDELRLWELEGGVNTASSRRKLASGTMSVRVQPETRLRTENPKLELVSKTEARPSETRLSSLLREAPEDLVITKGWVDFDDEKVVVLREKGHGGQALVVYDFT